MMEYVVKAKIPDYVFEHPTMVAMSQAINGILTWPNVRHAMNQLDTYNSFCNRIYVLSMRVHFG
jgi:hypothetical protein